MAAAQGEANRDARKPKPPQRSESATVVVVLALILAVLGYLLWRAASQPYLLKAKFSYADGLKTGAEVQLAGVKAGNVKQIRFLGIPTDNPEQEVFEVIMSINPTLNGKPAGELIRKDAVAVLISTGTLGDRSINIEPGNPNSPPTVNGDYIASRVEPTVAMLIDRSDMGRRNFYRVREILEENVKYIDAGHGTFGKFNVQNNDLDRHLKELTDSTDELQQVLDKGKGSFAKFQNDKRLKESFERLMKLSDQLRDDLQNGKGAIGKFLNDKEFDDRVNKLQTRANALSQRLDRLIDRAQNGQGALAKFQRDGRFNGELKELNTHIESLSRAVNTTKGTVGLVVNDKRLSENMSAISQEMLRLLYDIRKKPTKYVKFTFF